MFMCKCPCKYSVYLMLVEQCHPTSTSSPLFALIYIVKVRSCRAEQNLIKSGELTVLDKIHTPQLNCFLTAPQRLQKKEIGLIDDIPRAHLTVPSTNHSTSGPHLMPVNIHLL